MRGTSWPVSHRTGTMSLDWAVRATAAIHFARDRGVFRACRSKLSYKDGDVVLLGVTLHLVEVAPQFRDVFGGSPGHSHLPPAFVLGHAGERPGCVIMDRQE